MTFDLAELWLMLSSCMFLLVLAVTLLTLASTDSFVASVVFSTPSHQVSFQICRVTTVLIAVLHTLHIKDFCPNVLPSHKSRSLLYTSD